uniref:TIR domain-containing protein n=1 Tax=Steinernema glaseri TaxID=37863 RepID=A0A1I7YDN9_9BILA
MDSVPFAFCRDVCGFLGLEKEEFNELADTLTGRWKAAAAQYGENMTPFSLLFGLDDEGWYYRLNSCDRQTDIRSPGELRHLNQRYTPISWIGVDRPASFAVRCSREELVMELAPLLRARLRPCTELFMNNNGSYPRDAELAAVEMFGTPCTFYVLQVRYYSKESEDFVLSHLNNNPEIRSLVLIGFSHSTALEDQILRLLNSRSLQYLWLEDDNEDDTVGIRFTFEMFKTFSDAWYRTGTNMDCFLFAKCGGSIGARPEEILSLPVPPYVTRTVKIDEELDEVHYLEVRWTQKDGRSMKYKVDCRDNAFSILCAHAH